MSYALCSVEGCKGKGNHNGLCHDHYVSGIVFADAPSTEHASVDEPESTTEDGKSYGTE